MVFRHWLSVQNTGALEETNEVIPRIASVYFLKRVSGGGSSGRENLVGPGNPPDLRSQSWDEGGQVSCSS